MVSNFHAGDLVKVTSECGHYTWLPTTAVGTVNRVLELPTPLFEVYIHGQYCLFQAFEIRKVG